MNCTSCDKGLLKPNLIEENLTALTCAECKGNWILINDFVTWSERYPNHHFDQHISLHIAHSDTKKALICPASGVIMTKFQISSSTDHRIDYSEAVGGIWLDNGEWELLKDEGLANSLNSLVTEEWQQQIREDSAKNNFSKIYQNKFGDESYVKIKEIRSWLQSQSNSADLKAYLMAEDPYSAEK